MILECPECRTRYLVPDGAIGSAGRTVRCASCRHSWFQGAATTDAPVETPVGPIAAAPASPIPEPEPAPVTPPPPQPAFAPRVEPYIEPRIQHLDENTATPRRDPARRWTMAAVAAALVMVAGIVAILLVGAPGLANRLGLPFGGGETALKIKDNPIERRELDNGSELFAVSGQVLNPSGSSQRIPDIRAELRDAGGQLVHSWTITPQRRTLDAGAALDFNSATLDVPAASKRLELSFAGEE